MRAVQCESLDGYRSLRQVEVEAPALRLGSVRIAVHYATAGFAVTLVTAGKYQRKFPLPFIPGTEISGIVTEVAQDVSAFRPGDRVAAIIDWGGFAQEAVARTENVWHVPQGVDLMLACCVPATYGTAYASLHWRGRMEAHQSVLVFGAAGGVGLPAVEIAHLAGAHVIAVARTAQRLAVAREHGADEGFLSDTPDLGRLLKQRHEGRGIDLAFDPVGGDAFDVALRCMAPEGRILVIGFAGGDIQQIPANILMVKNIEVIGVNMGLYSGWTPVDERKRYAPRMQSMVNTLFGHVAAGRLRPEVSTVYPMEQVVQALDAVLERRSTGRILLRMV